MISSKDDYKYVTGDDLDKTKIDGQIYPLREHEKDADNNLLVSLRGEDIAFAIESAKERYAFARGNKESSVLKTDFTRKIAAYQMNAILQNLILCYNQQETSTYFIDGDGNKISLKTYDYIQSGDKIELSTIDDIYSALSELIKLKRDTVMGSSPLLTIAPHFTVTHPSQRGDPYNDGIDRISNAPTLVDMIYYHGSDDYLGKYSRYPEQYGTAEAEGFYLGDEILGSENYMASSGKVKLKFGIVSQDWLNDSTYNVNYYVKEHEADASAFIVNGCTYWGVKYSSLGSAAKQAAISVLGDFYHVNAPPNFGGREQRVYVYARSSVINAEPCKSAKSWMTLDLRDRTRW